MPFSWHTSLINTVEDYAIYLFVFAHPDDEEDLVATDVGLSGGAASAEEAAVHVVEEDDYDIRSE